jgi:bifunctional DNA-binding transcriptional regulator/antitoxin component of YhaV-PrlF toxin-antitoxin module
MVKIQEKNTGQKFITMPSQLAKSLNWKKGTDLILIPDTNGVFITDARTIRKLSSFSKTLRGMQK